MVARERLVLDRRRGARPARLSTATTNTSRIRTASPRPPRRCTRRSSRKPTTATRRRRQRGFAAAAQRVPGPRLHPPGRSARGERRGRHGARRRGREAALHDGAERRPRARDGRALRLARVLAYRDQHQEALALLERAEPGQFAGRIAEIRGDIHVALGETDAARTAYLEAMVASGAELLDRRFLQMKLCGLAGRGARAGARRPTAALTRRPTPRRMRRRGRRPPQQPRRATPGSRERAHERTAAHRGVGGCSPSRSRGCAGAARTRASRRPSSPSSTRRSTSSKVWSGKVGGKSERLRLGLRPATDGARIFAGAYDGQVAAFDAESGDKVWSVKTGLALTAGPGFGDGLLAFGTADGELLVLDAATGQERWRQAIGSEVLAAPAIGSGVIAVRTVDGRLRGFSVANGSTLWTVEQNLPSLTLRGNTAPRVAGTLVDQRLQQRPRRRLRDRERRSGVGSRDREPDGPQRARALGRRQRRPVESSATTSTSSAITAAPSASISRPASCSGSKTCRRTRAWAPTSTTST